MQTDDSNGLEGAKLPTATNSEVFQLIIADETMNCTVRVGVSPSVRALTTEGDVTLCASTKTFQR